MVMEHFQIYGIQITGKCICQSNIHYDPPPPQAKPSPVSYHHPQGNGKSLISQGLIFLKMQFPLAEEGRWGEVGGLCRPNTLPSLPISHHLLFLCQIPLHMNLHQAF